MAACSFCGRSFGSTQAVRRHLGYCETYLAQKGGAPKVAAPKVPAPTGTPLDDRAAQLQREVAAESARLRLRQIQADHRKLDDEEAVRARRAEEEARRAEHDRDEREAAELDRSVRETVRLHQELQEQRDRRRERLAREIADRALGWGDPHRDLPEDVRNQARAAVEAALAGLSEEQLLFTGEWLAAEARDRVYRAFLDAQHRQDEARQRDEEARRREAAAARASREEQDRRAREQTERLIDQLADKIADALAEESDETDDGEDDEDLDDELEEEAEEE